MRRYSVVFLVAGAALAAPGVASATYPGGDGLIAYMEEGHSDSQARADLYAIFPDGSENRPLALEAGFPSWSPDGRRIAYTRSIPREGEHPRSSIQLAGSDGGDEVRVTGGQFPSFSPSGRRLVMIRESGIRLVGVDGKAARLVLKGSFLRSPQFSPSGRRIAFSGIPRGRTANAIWTVRRDGSHLRKLTHPHEHDSSGMDWDPDYSPDGRRIVFFRMRTDIGIDTEIIVMRVNGHRERTIPGTNGFRDPAFSPTGERIAMVKSAVLSGCEDIWTMSPAGAGAEQVTGNCGDSRYGPTASGPAWQPVGPAPRRPRD